MNPRAPLSPRLLEELSAYLDGRLEGAEKAALEESLARDENLRRHLSELRTVRESLRALPPIKPPRALTLTRAQAGEPLRRFDWFSPRRMALGSALAAMAFVVVMAADLVSRGFTLGATSPQVESFAAPASLQSADQAAPTGGKANATALATQPPAALPAVTATGPAEIPGGGGSPATIGAPTLAEPPSDRCGEPSVTNKAAERCGVAGPLQEPVSKAFSLPDFPTLAPYLEVFLGITAVLLAVFAVFSRRRKK
jgi:hypothetical protein